MTTINVICVAAGALGNQCLEPETPDRRFLGLAAEKPIFKVRLPKSAVRQ